MIKARLISVLHSKNFTGASFAALAIMGGAYAYQKYSTRGASATELNISCFVYRDTNRNGSYDIADRPYAGMKITMNRPSGGAVAASSNISGFANFKMAYHQPSADIAEPGSYSIKVKPPQGWKVTSNNGEQIGVFARLEGSPAGIVATQPFMPVGVAPDLVIAGTIESNQPGSPLTLRAVPPRRASVDVPVSTDGKFSLPAEAGEWKLTLASADGRSHARTVLVGDYPVVISKLGRVDSTPPPAKHQRFKADFDSLTSSDTLYEIPNGYSGLSWSNWVATHQKLYVSDGTVNCNISSEYVAYNSSGLPATVRSEKNFDLVGLFMGVAWPRAESHDIIIKAWRGNRLAYEDRLRGTIRGPIYFDADYRDIDRVEISSAAFWQVVIDDMDFRKD